MSLRIRIMALLLMCAVGVYAGNAADNTANRHGVYVDLTGGSGLGRYLNVYGVERNSWGTIIGRTRNFGPAGGLETGLGVGGRFRLAPHWAWDMRVNFQKNYLTRNEEFFKNLEYQFMPIGVRWFSEDLGSRMSLFLGFNTGISLRRETILIPFELQIGVNLTRHLSVSIVRQYRLSVKEKVDEKLLFPEEKHALNEPYLVTGASNAFIGARLAWLF